MTLTNEVRFFNFVFVITVGLTDGFNSTLQGTCLAIFGAEYGYPLTFQYKEKLTEIYDR